jgi:asparagine synthase (glutamine-hydrolysing)
MSTDRPIGCLLSGGLDSSIIAYILSQEMKKVGKTLHTFSVGFPGSSDLFYAKKVSEHINSIHHELHLTYEDALNRIRDVAYALETYDITTIRASTPMFLLCEWINKNFPEKVIFSGEGSDELFCGYLYFHFAPSGLDAAKESTRLVNELYKYDVLRADRCTANNGLEFREPFLDNNVVDFALNLPGDIKKPNKIEKELLREAFSNCLPEDIIWRKKAAFSDAVSNLTEGKLWYQYIKDWIKDTYNMKEGEFYKSLFFENFKSYNPDIKLWLPKWTNTGDEPSATVLKFQEKNS